MNAKDLSVLLVDDELDDTVAALVLGNIASAVLERVALDLRIKTLCLDRLCGFADRGDLGVGVNDCGNGIIVHSVGLAEHIVDGNLALAVCGVGKHGLAVHVACRPDVCNVCLKLIVCNDSASLGKNADVLKTDALSHCASAYRYKNGICLCALLLAAQLIVHAVGADRCDLCAEKELYALLYVVFVKDLADLAVGRACDMIKHFDNGDLASDRIEVGSHFKSDDAAAYDDELLRDLLHVKDLAVGHCKTGGNRLTQTGDRRNGSGRAGADKEL